MVDERINLMAWRKFIRLIFLSEKNERKPELKFANILNITNLNVANEFEVKMRSKMKIKVSLMDRL